MTVSPPTDSPPATRNTGPNPAPATAQSVIDSVVAALANTPDPRLRQVMTTLVRHLHAFAEEVRLTEREWFTGIDFLTRTGRTCTDTRQEFILLSDILGLSMLVDLVNHPTGGAASDSDVTAVAMTESTVTGPFYVPGGPHREHGASIAERLSGDPAWLTGRVLDTGGRPIASAEVDVWQNGDNMLYAVQDPAAPPTNLRGVFRTRSDGSYALLGVRPVDYPIPDDGPVGELLTSTARHPWRPAHLHMTVRAPGYQQVTTHLFDDESRYLDSDAVFGVKHSLIRHFHRHAPGEADRPPGVGSDQVWYSVAFNVILAPAALPTPAQETSAAGAQETWDAAR
ncbi:Hydroxyquinol 1,2-dioxygenase [Frankia sp. Hr75.2]|nr:Hydroxyquinol 1,2-dioxygenase [Frankia sp. Hr75.2]